MQRDKNRDKKLNTESINLNRCKLSLFFKIRQKIGIKKCYLPIFYYLAKKSTGMKSLYPYAVKYTTIVLMLLTISSNLYAQEGTTFSAENSTVRMLNLLMDIKPSIYPQDKLTFHSFGSYSQSNR